MHTLLVLCMMHHRYCYYIVHYKVLVLVLVLVLVVCVLGVTSSTPTGVLLPCHIASNGQEQDKLKTTMLASTFVNSFSISFSPFVNQSFQ